MSTHNRPLYNKLYADMIRDKYPEKALLFTRFLKKKNWIALDVIEVNDILFGSTKNRSDLQVDNKHRAYDTASILQILQYQNNNKLSNVEIANEFGLSRNTIAKWKRTFCNRD